MQSAKTLVVGLHLNMDIGTVMLMVEQKVIVGDCRDVMQKMIDDHESFHAVLTDPPYLANVRDIIEYGHLQIMYEEWLPFCQKLIKPGGSIVVFELPRNWHDLYHSLEKAGFEVVHTAIWYAPDRYSFFGDWYSKYDIAMHAVNGPSRMKTWNIGNGANCSDVWMHNVVKNDMLHGAKPISIMQSLVRLLTNPGDSVLEPFMGTGSTLFACMNEGRSCTAIEIREELAKKVKAKLASAKTLEGLSRYDELHVQTSVKGQD